MSPLTPAQALIGLINPKSPANVGAVMRAVGCYQAGGVYYTGERYARAAQYQNNQTDTKNVAGQIPLNAVKELLSVVPPQCKVVCVELVEGATPLPQFVHPPQAFYVFGPEDGSLSQQMIDKADEVVYIPTTGCMNLAATVNVLLYDRMVKLSPQHGCDGLIRQSRDTNNRVKIKNGL